MGMGIFRVWTGTVNDSLTFPNEIVGTYASFDMITAIILIMLAMFSRKIVPLCNVPYIFLVTGLCMITCASLNFLSVIDPLFHAYTAFPAVVLGALGISLILMLWSEFFGCINPLRVALYYSASIIVSTLILWLFKGLSFYWLWAGTCLIPIISLGCLWRAYATLPASDYPHASWGQFSFPWKPILVVCLYSFAFGLHESIFTGYLSHGSGAGEAFAALFVFLGITLHRETFDFSSIWKRALPLMLVSLIPFNQLLIGRLLSDFCALASYTLYTILIMVILSNLSYRYGVCALWIFGIERAVRLISVQAGYAASGFIHMSATPSFADTLVTVATAGAIIATTVFFFSEKQLSSPWGVILKKTLAQDRELYREKNRIGMKCRELAKQYDLTTREEEILLLLSQGKKPSAIEQELYVAKSTVKTHVKHIYQKLGVHSREELFGLLGIQDQRSILKNTKPTPGNDL